MAGVRRKPLTASHQVGFEGAKDEADIQMRTKEMIARSLNIRRLTAFVGSGLSCAYGHPTWEQMTQKVVDFTLGTFAGQLDETTRKLLQPARRQGAESEERDPDPLPASPLARSDRQLLQLDLCSEQFEKRGRHPEFLQKLQDVLASYPHKRPARDPLGTIMKRLEIRRFLTINYDLEIERAFVRLMGCAPRLLGLDANLEPLQPFGRVHPMDGEPYSGVLKRARTLLVQPEEQHALIQFAVGAPGFEMGVLHCHGVQCRPESMVVTERDYQRLYLEEKRASRVYRDTLSLAFAGNPVLFMGVGMEENDLLRPLRQFVSERDEGVHDRPLFALLERPAHPASAMEFRRYLLTRYGVKVLYYPVEGDRTEAFCDAVEHLAEDWSDWWLGWQCKPTIRRAAFHQVCADPPTMIRHHWSIPKADTFSRSEDEDRLAEKLDEGPGVTLLLGRQGSGKGSIGIRLASGEIRLRETPKRRFYASTHFSNDLLSMIEGAAKFLGDANDESRAPMAVLREALMEGDHLCVFGGLERLFEDARSGAGTTQRRGRPSASPLPFGRPATPEIRELLELARDLAESGKSRLVLTCSVEPVGLEKTNIRVVQLRGVSYPALRRQHPFDTLDEDLVKRLRHALRGHAYALAVVRHRLLALPQDRREPWLNQLVTRMTSAELSRRAELALGAALEDLLYEEGRDSRRLLGILQRAALVTTPVTLDTMEAFCCDGDYSRDQLERDVGVLAGASLLIALAGERPSHSPRYTAHTLMRVYVLHTLGNLLGVAGEPQYFVLSSYSSEAEEVQLESAEGHRLSTRTVDAVLHRMETQLPDDPFEARGLIRAGFGFIRSRWTATGISRLSDQPMEVVAGLHQPHYESYHRRLARLLDVIRNAESGRGWYDEDVDTMRKVESETGVLYADELAWLYNEMGLGAFCQGLLHDAYALFRLGQDVNAVAESNTKGRRWRQSEMNLAIVMMERANLHRSRYHLNNALRVAKEQKDKQLAARAYGYLGLLHHLVGEYEQSQKAYDAALKHLEPGNRRGWSIFLRHRGDLLRMMNKISDAERDIAGSVSAAESGGHPDLLQFARIAQANLRLAQGEAQPPDVLRPAIELARKLGLPRLECDACKVQGHIALQNGEIEEAGRMAIRCLSISSALGMRLRLTAALILMGRVAAYRGDHEGARGLLRSAMEQAERQGYQLQLEVAQRELTELRFVTSVAQRSGGGAKGREVGN